MSRKKPTAGIILAAGMSKRFQQPKQLVKYKGKFLLEHVLSAAIGSNLKNIYLVLGHHKDAILETLSGLFDFSSLKVVFNPEYEKGLGRSLRAGMEAIDVTIPSVMFLLGDQPMVDSQMINNLLTNYWNSEMEICAPTYGDRRGNPTIFSKIFYNRLKTIEGDVGAREIIRQHQAQVQYVPIENPLYFFDIDSLADLELLKQKTNLSQ